MTDSEDDISESENTRYLSLYVRGQCFGAALYETESGILSLLPETPLDPSHDFKALQHFLFQINPHHLIAPTINSKSKVNDVLQRISKQSLESKDSPLLTQTTLHCLIGRDFHFESSRERLLSLQIFESCDSDEERFLLANSVIDFTSELTVRASGALLKFLDSRIPVTITLIKQLYIHDFVFCSPNSLEALQVFVSQNSASLSLFALLNKCQTRQGIITLKEMLRTPSRNLSWIQNVQDSITYLSGHESQMHSLQRALKGIKGLNSIMKRMSSHQSSLRDWKTLKKSIENALVLGKLCLQGQNSVKVLGSLVELTSEESLTSIAYFIEQIFDVSASEEKDSFVVKVGVDEVLDEKRRIHNGMPDLLLSVASEMIDELPDFMEECTMAYMPHVGYLFTIPPWRNDLTEEDYRNIKDCEFLFDAGDKPYFKNERCRQMDATLGDTATDIIELETSIIFRLSSYIVTIGGKTLETLNGLVGWLDAFISLTKTSMEFGWVTPKLVENGPLVVLKGRHPLQETCVESFVSNDINFSNHKIKLLTGPNASGKSVYLKQIGVIVFLAHVGCRVPAESAIIPLMDRIDTRIRTSESISHGLSAFLVDLTQMETAIHSSSKNSLVLIDEFGKGTSADDGEALFISTITYFLSLYENCPLICATTHFSNVFDFLPSTSQLRFQTFKTVSDGERLVYLYSLMDGVSRSSHALTVAQGAGIPVSVIERAEHILKLSRHPESIIPLSTSSNFASILEAFWSFNFDDEKALNTFITQINSLHV